MNHSILILLVAVVSASAITPGLLAGPRRILGGLGLGLGLRRGWGPARSYVSHFGTPVGPIGGRGGWRDARRFDGPGWGGELVAAGPIAVGGLGWGGDIVAAGPVVIDARGLGGLGWGNELVAAGPVAVGGLGWGGELVAAGPGVNTIAAINSGAISDANVAGITISNSIANANAASIVDANALARQINQQSQQNRYAAIQGGIDQAVAINQLSAVAQAQAVNQASQTAQRSANQAALHQNAANQNLAAQLNAINGGAARDAAINQANAIGQVASVNANAAQAAFLNQGGVLVAGGLGHGAVNHLG